MRYLFYCHYCKKQVEKKVIKIGNTHYIPIQVTHSHNFVERLLEQIIPPEIKGY